MVDQHLGYVRLASEHEKVGAQEIPEPPARGRAGTPRCFQGYLDLLADLLYNRRVQARLVAEVVVEQRRIDPGALSDLANRCPGKSFFGEYLSGDTEKVLPSATAVGPDGSPGAS
jgi:hypothetical protein